MYKALIFDFFGVFCTSIATNWFKRIVPNDKSKLSVFQALCTQSDYGNLSRADFNKEVSKLTGVSVTEIIQGIESETIINTSLVTYVKELRIRGYTIACLSNGTREWTLRVINDHGLGSLFDEVVLSGDLGIIKPSSEIYIHTLEKLKVRASQAVFVDDRKVNTDAAEACGISSIVFNDTSIFVKELENLLQLYHK
ncbi:MAG TPA: HAD-IA family hydrolase [Methylomirabilota bacterium]|nr:HAD-IA family hydrolase [Methylomirabilota bacterium]